MIEAYAFLAMFALQVLAMSVLYPTWFIRKIRAQAENAPVGHLAQLYPDVDFAGARERFLSLYRTVSAGIAASGLLLLGWLSSYMLRPGWDHDDVSDLAAVYFIVQMLPMLCIAVLGARSMNVLRRSLPDGKRKALLQRRGLFDFVSPLSVLLAALGYFVFIALVIYVQQHPFPGFAGLTKKVVGVTSIYAVKALVVYWTLYGKKMNPFESSEDRVHTIGVTVRICVYGCIACVVFVSIDLALGVLDWRYWEPFSLSALFVTTAFLCLRSLRSPPRRPEGDGLSRSVAPQ